MTRNEICGAVEIQDDLLHIAVVPGDVITYRLPIRVPMVVYSSPAIIISIICDPYFARSFAGVVGRCDPSGNHLTSLSSGLRMMIDPLLRVGRHIHDGSPPRL